MLILMKSATINIVKIHLRISTLIGYIVTSFTSFGLILMETNLSHGNYRLQFPRSFVP